MTDGLPHEPDHDHRDCRDRTAPPALGPGSSCCSRRLARRPERSPGGSTRQRHAPGPLPLSTGQQQMWFLSRLEPDSWEYAAPLALRLRGRVGPGPAAAGLRRRRRPPRDPAHPLRSGWRSAGAADRPARARRVRARAAHRRHAGRAGGSRCRNRPGLFPGRPFVLEEQWPLRARLIADRP